VAVAASVEMGSGVGKGISVEVGVGNRVGVAGGRVGSGWGVVVGRGSRVRGRNSLAARAATAERDSSRTCHWYSPVRNVQSADRDKA
jgi:hypothetical protein